GPLTCQLYEGSYNHEEKDAVRYAEWGFDYLKYDLCGYRAIVNSPSLEEAVYPFKKMGDALQKVNRDIVYSASGPKRSVWKWGSKAELNVWRTTGDIYDDWKRVVKIGFEQQVGLAPYAG